MIKRTLEGLNQEELIQNGLDLTDVIILRWFIDFQSTNKMNFVTENGTIFYLVKYEAIIESYPILGISTTKGIAKRFEHYVEIGLMKKTVKRGGIYSGVSVFFAFTEKLQELLYDKNKYNSDKNSSSYRSTTQESDENHSSYRSSNQQNNHKTTQNTVKNSENYVKNDDFTSSGTTLNSDKNSSSYRSSESDSDKNHSSHRLEPQFQAIRTPVPIALNNTSAINSSVINSSATSTEAENFLQEKIDSLFGPNIFSQDLIPNILKTLRNFEIAEKEKCNEYLDYAYKYCQEHCKNQSNLAGYFYKCVCQNYMISNYLDSCQKIIKQKQSTEIDCPVCGLRHIYIEPCSCCGLVNYKNKTEIDFRKKVFELEPQQKKNLQMDLNNIFVSGMELFQTKKMKESIYNKYINFSHEDYVKIFG